MPADTIDLYAIGLDVGVAAGQSDEAVCGDALARTGFADDRDALAVSDGATGDMDRFAASSKVEGGDIDVCLLAFDSVTSISAQPRLADRQPSTAAGCSG